MLAKRMRNIVLLPFDVFRDAFVDTVVFIAEQVEPEGQLSRTFSYPKKSRVNTISLSDADYQQLDQTRWLSDATLRIVLETGALDLIESVRKSNPETFESKLRVRRGVLFDKAVLRPNKSEDRFRYFEGDVYRYSLRAAFGGYIPFDDSLKERPRTFNWFSEDRLLLRRLVNRQQRLMATFASGTFITNKNLYAVLPNADGPSLATLLALINSKLISFIYVKQVTQAVKDDFAQVTIKDFVGLPFPKISKRCAELDTLANSMLMLHERCAGEELPQRREQLQREIDATDRQIDALVYQLYGLTDDEIRIVEEATA